MDNYLVVTALCKNRPEDLEQFTRTIKEIGCSISESRMTVLGSEFCIQMMLSGPWDSIAKIEDLLPRLGDKLSISFMAQRTAPARMSGKLMPYAIDVVAVDRAGIVHDIVNFIHENKIVIQELQTNTYKAATTGATMFSLHLAINIPADFSIAGIRGDFMEFCDQLNLDAIMEPVK
ncbi:MAG: glycine cleavage system protein R [Gammaproteobacteria bacterium RIFCSPLOWO2_02_FULL_47_50]|jgi:glycine cleavage system transcriptional repressor|nr:MAG: glycine cleavage system protein R [Gammaproteobacteria bacterium RIFCSPLOWO2_01_FULL_47_190]OGT73742.1 MAG: glycine cleavage system protein R [Gammaproteobacteria bacterium RIFCSPLOWO2_12_47_11]OGT78175.1 MAG: glycine cleavage system protein R [Gammaproteobacteria bacterium RIFCSPLOWO2_02_FULL_47_50]OGT83891.1 MAG: glycine cleavage system protein R [Gammaproteobacteria bacterium RIFCSPLOWO2_12_FULL_47_76]